MNSKAIIEVRDLVARYGETTILDGISFDVYEGEILVILGQSGCGKSTLLKHLVGLIPAAAGRISFWGEDITGMDEEALDRILRRIGISFQGGALFNSMSVAENVALPMEESGQIDPRLIDILVRMKLSLVGLGESGSLMPSALSGGMKKRVGFARAIAVDPEIVFFDEPSAGLDPIMAAGLDKIILDIRKILGATVVVVTHELASIRTVADRVLMIDKGGIIFDGPVDEAEKSDRERVYQFFHRIPDKVIGVEDKIEIPNNKHQISNKSQ